MSDSEFEDCIDPDLYKDGILSKYGVDLSSSQFRGNKKWSERMKSVFMDQGKPWNDAIKKEIKLFIADLVSKNPKTALHQHKRNSIDALVTAVEGIIQS